VGVSPDLLVMAGGFMGSLVVGWGTVTAEKFWERERERGRAGTRDDLVGRFLLAPEVPDWEGFEAAEGERLAAELGAPVRRDEVVVWVESGVQIFESREAAEEHYRRHPARHSFVSPESPDFVLPGPL
jgi:hypothetical protein